MKWTREQQADGTTVWADEHGSRWRVPDFLREDRTELWTFWRAVAEFVRLDARDRALHAHWHRAITEHPPERGSLLPSVEGR